MGTLEIGGGSNPKYCKALGNGVNIDVRAMEKVDVIFDFNKLDGSIHLPYENELFDKVYSAYLLEHISWRKVKYLIQEICRLLTPNGEVTIITANLFEQCKAVANSAKWEENFPCMLFGDQDYPENSHKVGWSPEGIRELFMGYGFGDVKVTPHPNCNTDMIIVARKTKMPTFEKFVYDREYWEDGKTGYLDYRDFPVHYATALEVLKRKPESVLEIGGGRGYISRLLKNSSNIKTLCLDGSEHCWHTRATDSFGLCNLTETPWVPRIIEHDYSWCWIDMLYDAEHSEYDGQILSKEYDLCFSIAFLEHVPEFQLADVIKEMARVTRRGFHGITFSIAKNDIDASHRLGTIKPKEWWIAKFKEVAPDYPVEIVDKEELEPSMMPMSMIPPPDGKLKLNLGSYKDMYHYGWENLDIIDLTQYANQNAYIYKYANLAQPLQYQDNSVDIIVASHFLEHFSFEEGDRFLSECFRVMKPTGIIRITVPDARLITKMCAEGFLKDICSPFNISVAKAKTETEALYEMLFGGHKSIYDSDILTSALEKAGFKNILVSKFYHSSSAEIELQTIDKYPTISLYVEATKLPTVSFVSVDAKLYHAPGQQVLFNEEVSKGTFRKEGATMIQDALLVTKPEPLHHMTPKTSTSKLRIGLLSTPFIRTPPDAYGGLEQIVADLAESLAEMGHEVHVFATNGSNCKGCIMHNKMEPLLKVHIDWLTAESQFFSAHLQEIIISNLDILHGHNWFGMEYMLNLPENRIMLKNKDMKICHTHHGGLNNEFWCNKVGQAWEVKPSPFKLNFISISKFMADAYYTVGVNAKPVYNGINIPRYLYKEEKGNRLLYVGRIDGFKQPHLAIELAQKLGVGLDLVGGTFVQDFNYLNLIRGKCNVRLSPPYRKEEIDIELSPENRKLNNIVLWEDAPHEVKMKLMQDAKCVVFPSAMGEPFGLVPVEAMACGTAVIAFNDGAIEEVVKQGGVVAKLFDKKFVNGTVAYSLLTNANTVDLLADALKHAEVITSPQALHNGEEFSRENMAKNYLKCYQDMLEGREW